MEYASEHEGRFPSALSELAPEYVGELKYFTCPGSGKEVLEWKAIDRDSDYALTPNLSTQSSEETVLLREITNNNHSPGGYTVCTVLGRTLFVSEE
jgi:hypothetical protein